MNYCCEQCGFVFSRKGEVAECPFCESQRIRPANENETKHLQELLSAGKE